jgi:beta-1,4-mannooligosaccharide/beta-1,4-mannosyl-N-acetylglucosamine phosphorylase
MATTLLNPVSIPNLPWEAPPPGSSDVVWRYSQNPIIPRNLIPRANSIFNSAVVPYKGQYAGVFRIDDTRRVMNLYRGFSENGVDWQIDPAPIEWRCADP